MPREASERVKAARAEADTLYWSACSSQSMSDRILDELVAAVRSECAEAGRGETEDAIVMRSLHIENPPDKPWSAKAGFDGPAVELFAAAFCDFYRKSGGENYVEMQMRDPASPTEEFVVTVQRKAGKTPHELRRAAEAELAQLRAALRSGGHDGTE